MAHDALRVPGRAGRVVDRDRVPLVPRHRPGEARIALGHERLVVHRLDRRVRTGELGIGVLHNDGLHARERERLLHDRHELPVRDHDGRSDMVELKGDAGRVLARVDRMQHGTAHRHAVVALQHRRRVRQQHRYGIAVSDTAPIERGGQLHGPRMKLGIAATQRAVNDRDVIRENAGGPLEERQRREGLVVRRGATEIGVVGIVRHRLSDPAIGASASR